ncbi:MAG: hypothetical protein ACRCSG_02530 [Cellulosilyticaceae bacterium]
MRKIIMMFMSLCIVFSLAGCTSSAETLTEYMENVNKWKAVNSTGNTEIEVLVGTNNFKIDIAFDIYKNQKEEQYSGVITIDEVVWGDEKRNYLPDDFKLSPILFFVDNMKVYVSNTFIKELTQYIKDGTLDALYAEIDEIQEYILIDTERLGHIEKETIDEYVIYKSIESNSNFKKEDNKFELTLKGGELLDTCYETIIQLINEKAIIDMDLIQVEGLSKDRLEEMLNVIKSPETKQMVDLFKMLIPNAEFDIKYDFNKKNYSVYTNLDLPVKLGKNLLTHIKFRQNVELKKTKLKTIVFPNNFKEIDVKKFIDGSY